MYLDLDPSIGIDILSSSFDSTLFTYDTSDPNLYTTEITTEDSSFYSEPTESNTGPSETSSINFDTTESNTVATSLDFTQSNNETSYANLDIRQKVTPFRIAQAFKATL